MVAYADFRILFELFPVCKVVSLCFPFIQTEPAVNQISLGHGLDSPKPVRLLWSHTVLAIFTPPSII